MSGGSMSDTSLRRFSVMNAFHYGVPSIDDQFDTQITAPPVTLKRAQRRVLVHGRGGTGTR
jgi:hypothetical protein